VVVFWLYHLLSPSKHSKGILHNPSKGFINYLEKMFSGDMTFARKTKTPNLNLFEMQKKTPFYVFGSLRILVAFNCS
jgi:hypothetical protein